MDIDDQALPAKKSKLQPVQEKTVKPAERTKAAGVAENGRDGGTKDLLEEKQSVREETEKREIPVTVEKEQGSEARSQASCEESSGEKPIVQSGTAVSPSTVDASSTTRDQPLPPAPPDAQPVPVPPISTEALQAPAVNVQEPTPTVDQEVPPTPEWTPNSPKRKVDVDMPDAPPEEAAVVEGETTQSPTLPTPEAPKTDLPPPPPIEQRQSQVISKEVPAVPDSSQGKQVWLLPPVQPQHQGRKCLVLDLDETLVHSSFKILNQADFTIPVEIEGQYHNVYVIKRPGVDAFMKRVGELYEVVVFTASVSKYGDPLLDQLDVHHVVHHRLFRESCYNHQGNYVKVGSRGPSGGI